MQFHENIKNGKTCFSGAVINAFPELKNHTREQKGNEIKHIIKPKNKDPPKQPGYSEYSKR